MTSTALSPIPTLEFALSLAQVGLLKTAHSAVMVSLQVQAGFLAERLGERALLALGTAVAGLGYLLTGVERRFLRACHFTRIHPVESRQHSR